MNCFGDKLKLLRKEFGITQKELAERIGVHENSICSYETGKRFPPLDVIYKISDLFGISSDYLLNPDAKESLTLNGMTPRQQEIIRSLADEFRSLGARAQTELTPRQRKIITDAFSEFTSGPVHTSLPASTHSRLESQRQ